MHDERIVRRIDAMTSKRAWIQDMCVLPLRESSHISRALLNVLCGFYCTLLFVRVQLTEKSDVSKDIKAFP